MSLALLGAVFGSLIAGPLSDALGRKPILISADFLFTIGSINMAFAPTIPVLMGGRVIVGVAIGIASMVTPVYLSEVSPVIVRGTVVSVFILSVTTGQLLSSIISLGCGRNWRLMLGLAAVPSTIQGIWLFFMPETQRWLAIKQREVECKQALVKVYKESDVEVQYRILKREVNRMRPFLRQSEWERYV